MHPEHKEHYRQHRTVRLEPGDMRQTTVVVRCGRVRRWRIWLAMALMKVASRIAGFKNVRLTREG